MFRTVVFAAFVAAPFAAVAQPVAAQDHCVFVTPASYACPVNGAEIAAAQAHRHEVQVASNARTVAATPKTAGK